MNPAVVDSVEPPTPGSTRYEGRAAQEAERVGQLEQEEPLRGRVLKALAEEPSTPTELARGLGAHKESISRVLKALRQEDLVEMRRVPGDRRRRRYVLTAAGSVELSRHHAYGDPGPSPEEPTSEETLLFLQGALRESVQLRRTDNRLEEAAERQEKILREARKIGDGELVVETMHELATTLRQGREDEGAEKLLDELDEIALGRSGYSGAGLGLQAAAHRAYGLGRLREGEDEELGPRLGHLIAAASNYRDLAEGSLPHASARWSERQAWSMVSLAANLRAGTRLEHALGAANKALDLFEEIEDPYGRSHSLFLLGYCLRLLGDFDSAWFWLTQAHTLAEEKSYERFKADSLLQMGEVLRCRGDLSEADEALRESRERAVAMGLGVIQAYAHSALGAVAFQQGRLPQAQLELNRAQEQFSGIVNREGLVLRANEGMALNARRIAAVTRLMAESAASRHEREASLGAARRYTDSAQEYYWTNRKPAGVVACKVEHDRLRMSEGKEPEKVRELLDLLELHDREHERERTYLEKDPWVPGLLHTFSEETGSQPLKERSLQLLEKARRRLGEEVKRVMKRRPAGRPEKEPQHENQSDAMGGEPRQIVDEAELSVV